MRSFESGGGWDTTVELRSGNACETVSDVLTVAPVTGETVTEVGEGITLRLSASNSIEFCLLPAIGCKAVAPWYDVA